jgi:hypothetical protein
VASLTVVLVLRVAASALMLIHRHLKVSARRTVRRELRDVALGQGVRLLPVVVRAVVSVRGIVPVASAVAARVIEAWIVVLRARRVGLMAVVRVRKGRSLVGIGRELVGRCVVGGSGRGRVVIDRSKDRALTGWNAVASSELTSEDEDLLLELVEVTRKGKRMITLSTHRGERRRAQMKKAKGRRRDAPSRDVLLGDGIESDAFDFSLSGR